MADTPEGRVKRAIKKYLATLPMCWWFMPVSAGYGTHGVPDIIMCYKGHFISIEVKRPGNERGTTKLQDMQLAAIRSAGGTAIVASSVEQVRDVIEVIDQLLHGRGEEMLGP